MRKNKAVSPVIATLLLILIAVAAAVLVYVWVTGYATSVTATGTPELREKIKIEAVKYESNTLTIYVRNVGEKTVTIDYVYVLTADTGEIADTYDADKQISVNAVEEITATGISLTPGTTYVVKVVTTNGVEAAATFTA